MEQVGIRTPVVAVPVLGTIIGVQMTLGPGPGFCQRRDPKIGNPEDYPHGFGPQGDVRRIYNFVRCVRDAN